MSRVVAIVSADGPANVGDLICDLSPVGTLTQGESAEGKGAAAEAGEVAKRIGVTTDRRWLASYYRRIPAGFGSDRWSATAPALELATKGPGKIAQPQRAGQLARVGQAQSVRLSSADNGGNRFEPERDPKMRGYGEIGSRPG
jgi:hypothetical protein